MYIREHDIMALFSIGTLWSLTPGANAGDAQILTLNDAAAGKMLTAEYGVEREKHDFGKALTAVKDPGAAYKLYTDALDALAAKMAPGVRDDIKTLIDIGYPLRAAEELAVQKSKEVFAQERKLIELKHPMMSNHGALMSAEAGVDLRAKAPKAPKVKKSKKQKTLAQ